LDPDLISKEKVYYGYWNSASKDISKKLWLPTGIDYAGSDSTYSNGSVNNTESISLFKTLKFVPSNRNSLKTLWPSYTYSLAGLTEKEDIKKPSKVYYQTRTEQWKQQNLSEEQIEPLRIKDNELLIESQQSLKMYTRCQKIPLDVTDRQRIIFQRWFSAARATYNRALGDVKRQSQTWLQSECIKSIEAYLRRKYVIGDALKNSKQWKHLLYTPADVRKDAVSVLVSDIKRFRTNNEKQLFLRKKYPLAKKFKSDIKFSVHFQHKRYSSASISMEAKSFKLVSASDSQFMLYESVPSYTKKTGVVKDIMINIAVKKGKWFALDKNTVQHDFKIHYAYGTYYLLAPFITEVEQTAELSLIERNKRQAMSDSNLNSDTTISEEVKEEEDVSEQKVGKKRKRIIEPEVKYIFDGKTRKPVEMINEAEKKNRNHTSTWFLDGGPEKRDKIGAMDPGVRKPYTIYSPEGGVEIFGCNANKVIDKYVRRVDKWKRIHGSSELDKKNIRLNDDMEDKERIKKRARNKYRHTRKKWVKARCRLQNAIKHFQYNVAHQLCRNYETLLIPTYSTKRLVLKEGRKLPLKVIKRMQALSFSQFTNRLKQVASLYPGTVV